MNEWTLPTQSNQWHNIWHVHSPLGLSGVDAQPAEFCSAWWKTPLFILRFGRWFLMSWWMNVRNDSSIEQPELCCQSLNVSQSISGLSGRSLLRNHGVHKKRSKVTTNQQDKSCFCTKQGEMSSRGSVGERGLQRRCCFSHYLSHFEGGPCKNTKQPGRTNQPPAVAPHLVLLFFHWR